MQKLSNTDYPAEYVIFDNATQMSHQKPLALKLIQSDNDRLAVDF